MNSNKEAAYIRNIERKSFQEWKLEENKNRSIPISPDILYISDFTLEKYANGGDSGDLYLAVNKHNPLEKYVLKHEYYDCACNEYMYSKIGNKMGIKVAPVKLFILDNKKKAFKSDFVCGIKYFEDCEHVNFDYIKKHKNDIDNWMDYFRMRSLESLFGEGDGIEVVKYHQELYRIDTTDAFNLSEYFIHLLAYNFSDENGKNIRKMTQREILLNAFGATTSRMDMWMIGLKSFLNLYGEEYLPYYLETFRLLWKVSEEDMEEWTYILTWFYPNVIGEYFKIYLINLKLDAEEFLDRVAQGKLDVTVS